MDDFYRDYILDHYRSPHNFGRLEKPDAQAEDVNPLCGDSIRMELELAPDGTVREVSVLGKGLRDKSGLGLDAHRSIKGMKLEDVAKLSKDVVLENVGIGISPTRMKCAMLGLRVLKSAAIGELAGWPDEE